LFLPRELDRINSKLEAQHNAVLDSAATLHERVLEEAEEALRSHQWAVEEDHRCDSELEVQYNVALDWVVASI
jgi:hypothetical protein